MAFRATDIAPGAEVDYTVVSFVLVGIRMGFSLLVSQPQGTRLFQSICVLDSCDPIGFAPDHDYLDELESFLYVLAYILLLFRPDGSLLPSGGEGPSIVWSWGLGDPGRPTSTSVHSMGTTQRLTSHSALFRRPGILPVPPCSRSSTPSWLA
jgi:hypothetical protein